jgi:hypothetical protein
MQPLISVILCTHNPKRQYLKRVLDALKAQTLLPSAWELLLVDNASDQVLASEIDLSWHGNSRHIREETLGLTPARLRGIKEVQSELLVFVDDDNILDSDYLEVALQIGRDFPLLGAWGGQIRPEFEVTPPDWTKPYWGYLAIREFEQDKWSNLLHQHETTPCGAGLCIRKVVAEKYAYRVNNDPKRLMLGRKGNQLTSCEDSDLAFTACDIGLGTGQFTALKLTHLMPSGRLEEQYLLRLIEGMEYSHTLLDSLRGKLPVLPVVSWQSRLLECYRSLRMSPRDREFYQARKRGLSAAIQTLSKIEQ